MAQTSVLSVGMQCGGQTWLPSAAVGATGTAKGAFGVAGSVDIRYTFYGQVGQDVGVGFALGAGVGYGTTGLQGTNVDRFTNSDYLNNQLDYTVTSAFRQTEQFVRTEASLMMAFRFRNVTLNIGPRLMMPFAVNGSMSLKDVTISAYYPRLDVTVTNELITGYLETPYTQPIQPSLPKYNVLMGVEIGYEWHFSERHGLGIQVYANCGVWNNYVTQPAGQMVSVSAISNAAQPLPVVSVNGVTEGLLSGRRYLDFGLRAYYAFTVPSTYIGTRRQPSRDTRNHHNRYLWNNL